MNAVQVAFARHYADVRRRLNGGNQTKPAVTVKLFRPEPEHREEPAETKRIYAGVPPRLRGRSCYKGPIGPVRPARDVLMVATPMAGAEIVRDVAIKHGVTIGAMKSHLRQRRLILARHEAMWRLHTELHWSYVKIGNFMGGRDHTTALHGVRAHEARMSAEVA